MPHSPSLIPADAFAAGPHYFDDPAMTDQHSTAELKPSVGRSIQEAFAYAEAMPSGQEHNQLLQLVGHILQAPDELELRLEWLRDGAVIGKGLWPVPKMLADASVSPTGA